MCKKKKRFSDIPKTFGLSGIPIYIVKMNTSFLIFLPEVRDFGQSTPQCLILFWLPLFYIKFLKLKPESGTKFQALYFQYEYDVMIYYYKKQRHPPCNLTTGG